MSEKTLERLGIRSREESEVHSVQGPFGEPITITQVVNVQFEIVGIKNVTFYETFHIVPGNLEVALLGEPSCSNKES